MTHVCNMTPTMCDMTHTCGMNIDIPDEIDMRHDSSICVT